jgi:hypothetical protein
MTRFHSDGPDGMNEIIPIVEHARRNLPEKKIREGVEEQQ